MSSSFLSLISSHHYDFTVCVSPLHSFYNKDILLKQFIAFNRMLGVDHFVFYKQNISRATATMLERYKTTITVINWSLPSDVSSISERKIENSLDMYYHGQLVALNDCLYRSKNSSYVLFSDVDEFVVPRRPLHDFKSLMQVFTLDH